MKGKNEKNFELYGFVLLEGKSGRIENILTSPLGVWLMYEKMEGWKIFYLVENKYERIENKVCINLQPYPY